MSTSQGKHIMQVTLQRQISVESKLIITYQILDTIDATYLKVYILGNILDKGIT